MSETITGRDLNKKIRTTVRDALKELIYTETGHNAHIDIEECPRNELMWHGGCRGISKTTGKRFEGLYVATKYYARWMDGAAMRRDHLSRAIGDLQQNGEAGRNETPNMERSEISRIEEDWGVHRDGSKDSMKFPLLTYEEWDVISRITYMNWRNCGDLVMEENGVMLKWCWGDAEEWPVRREAQF